MASRLVKFHKDWKKKAVDSFTGYLKYCYKNNSRGSHKRIEALWVGFIKYVPPYNYVTYSFFRVSIADNEPLS